MELIDLTSPDPPPDPRPRAVIKNQAKTAPVARTALTSTVIDLCDDPDDEPDMPQPSPARPRHAVVTIEKFESEESFQVDYSPPRPLDTRRKPVSPPKPLQPAARASSSVVFEISETSG